MAQNRTAIGIDTGGTNIRIAEINEKGAILRRHVERVTSNREDFLSRVIELVAAWTGDDEARRRIAAIGIGIPGRVDSVGRRILSAGFLDLAAVPLIERLSNVVDLPIAIENDAGMALVAELAIGAAWDVSHVVMFTIGTGIGGAIALDRHLVHGRMTAGQLGHITVLPNTCRCNCGRTGCVETTSSGTALHQHMADNGFAEGTTVEQLFDLADGGNLAATVVLNSWARPMRDAATSMAAVFDPDVILLGGGLGGAMYKALQRLPPEDSWYRYAIRPASLGDDAGVVGAGLRALRLAQRDNSAESLKRIA